jgi:F5/8 type C domain-containing protein
MMKFFVLMAFVGAALAQSVVGVPSSSGGGAAAAAAPGGTTIFSSGGNPNGGTFSPQNMTGNSAPSPYVVSASSDNGASAYFSWNAFKPGTADEWLAATGPPAFLEIDLSAGNAAICGNYTIYYNVFGTTTDAPKTWTFQGSNDNSTWATLDTQTNVALAAPSTTVFTCSPATTAYRYFKLAITASNGGPNVGISRLYINAVGVTSGVAGDWYYQTSANQFFGPRPAGATPVWPPQAVANFAGVVSNGATFTTSGCSATLPVGGATAGSYTSGTSGTCTVVVTPGVAAPHGWACKATDLTTPADVITQTATTLSTFTFSGTTVSADVINFSCTGY